MQDLMLFAEAIFQVLSLFAGVGIFAGVATFVWMLWEEME